MELLIAGVAALLGFTFGVHSAGLALNLYCNMKLQGLPPQSWAFYQALGGLLGLVAFVRLVVYYLLPIIYH